MNHLVVSWCDQCAYVVGLAKTQHARHRITVAVMKESGFADEVAIGTTGKSYFLKDASNDGGNGFSVTAGQLLSAVGFCLELAFRHLPGRD